MFYTLIVCIGLSCNIRDEYLMKDFTSCKQQSEQVNKKLTHDKVHGYAICSQGNKQDFR